MGAAGSPSAFLPFYGVLTEEGVRECLADPTKVLEHAMPARLRSQTLLGGVSRPWSTAISLVNPESHSTKADSGSAHVAPKNPRSETRSPEVLVTLPEQNDRKSKNPRLIR